MQDFAEAAAERGEHFFYIRIHESLGPMDRGDRYEDPLGNVLEQNALGRVTGGGSQLGENDTIEYCGIDVVVADRDLGLQLIKKSMRELNASDTTVIEEYLPEYRDHSI